jgi:hypothetical protein
VIDRIAAIKEKIKACEDRLVFLRSLLPKPPSEELAVLPTEPVKRGPGRPKKAA